MFPLTTINPTCITGPWWSFCSVGTPGTVPRSLESCRAAQAPCMVFWNGFSIEQHFYWTRIYAPFLVIRCHLTAELVGVLTSFGKFGPSWPRQHVSSKGLYIDIKVCDTNQISHWWYPILASDTLTWSFRPFTFRMVLRTTPVEFHLNLSRSLSAILDWMLSMCNHGLSGTVLLWYDDYGGIKLWRVE